MKISDIATVKGNYADADFWITRRGTRDEVGRPVNQFDKEKIGVKVTRTDIVNPRYLFYVFTYLHGKGVFKLTARGTTQLVHITTDEIKNLPIQLK